MGYHRAGFDVVGVDIAPQPLYPFEFVQGDAIAYVREHGHEFDAIHASPPCQAFTTMSNRYRGKGGKADAHVDLIGPTRAALEATARPYVIENVVGARRQLRGPILLTGAMFGLRVARPRLFESSIALEARPERKVDDVVGVYGARPDGRRLWTRADGTEQRAAASVAQAAEVMGMPWASWHGLTQAIPPAYTQFLGEQLVEHLALVTA